MEEKNWLKSVLKFSKQCKGLMIASVICATISVIGGIIPYFAVYNIIVLFIDKIPKINEILFWIGICVTGHIINLLFYSISTILSHNSAYTILETIRSEIAEKLMKVPLGTVLNKPIGDFKNAIIDRVETIEIPLAHLIPEVSSNILLIISIFIYLLYIDWRMALACSIPLPIGILTYIIMMRDYKEKFNNYMEASNYVNSVIVEYTEGIEVIKAFNQSSSSYEKFTNAVKSFKIYTLDWFKSTWKSISFANSIMPSTLIGTLPIGIYLYLKGTLSPVDLVMCLILSLGIVTPLMAIIPFIDDMSMLKYAVEDAMTYLNLPELKNKECNINIDKYNIELNNISFSYNENLEEVILSNINLKFDEGKFYALVGPSGGGKSTIAKLIARFWDVSTGEILIGNTNIKNISLKQLADLVSFVTQDNFLFNCSIKENIRLGNPNATDEEVYTAAQAAQCDEFIKNLDHGYNTKAGEAGKQLSGGEKQRIAIARALLKNSPIVILDEATAFTDPENELKIQKSIALLTKGKTLIVIAHRLSTIKHADKIIVLKKGKVLDSGSHEELLEKCSLYYDMWQAHIGAKKWSANVKLKEEYKNV
ncbi:ABC transporter ATP-binding protein [Hathewaya limosa]|uniref:ATP-binding cassette subfamily B protein n=1 Tax=Hathewaya limosa TaxID=1536 RepID=A0ABU0JQX4_HATLI|nr:ABC transporter ATP-binding protein [Hathewaya limosa]MDQ0478840.1 ATP-binding cassette subfamily B protein [Hathewaya limosa]